MTMKTQRLRKIGSDVRKVRFVGLLAAAASVLVFVAQPKTAHATTLACGATITNNVTLTADVGPCTGSGVTIGANNVTWPIIRHCATTCISIRRMAMKKLYALNSVRSFDIPEIG